MPSTASVTKLNSCPKQIITREMRCIKINKLSLFRLLLIRHLFFIVHRGIFIFGGGNKRLRNVTKMYCQCQISHKRRKKECLGKFKFSLN
jgi:hypothetical protein